MLRLTSGTRVSCQKVKGRPRTGRWLRLQAQAASCSDVSGSHDLARLRPLDNTGVEFFFQEVCQTQTERGGRV